MNIGNESIYCYLNIGIIILNVIKVKKVYNWFYVIDEKYYVLGYISIYLIEKYFI